MKIIETTLASTMAITGLVLAGGEAQTMLQQFLLFFIGMGMLVGGGLWIYKIHGRF